MNDVLSLPTFEDLKKHVHDTLCEKDRLDPSQTPIHHSLIIRRQKPCGMFFHVQGPRLLKNYALWSSDEHRILFYDGRGDRFHETRLVEAPDVPRASAA